jgi:hypothetical protein
VPECLDGKANAKVSANAKANGNEGGKANLMDAAKRDPAYRLPAHLEAYERVTLQTLKTNALAKIIALTLITWVDANQVGANQLGANHLGTHNLGAN